MIAQRVFAKGWAIGMTILMETKNVTYRLPAGGMLHFPDVRIGAGESLLLLGASGTGKTTFLSILAGLLPPTTGHVLWRGDDVYAMPTKSRDALRGKSFGFVFQTLHLLPYLTAFENVALAAKIPGIDLDLKRITALFKTLGIAEKLRHKPHQLSHGERQRVAIARAVLNQPAIVFADEPTSALDDKNSAQTIDLIKSQARDHKASLILATHDHRITHGFDLTVDLNASMTEAA
jgi:ABC-type lipoprotein export system ATPase subunit